FGERTAPNRDKNLVGIEFHLVAVLGCRNGCAAIIDLDRAYLSFEMKNDTLRSQQALEQIRQLKVEADSNTRKKFQYRHFRTEPVPNRTQLEADRACADHKKFLRRLRKTKCFRAADNSFAIKLRERQLDWGA